MDLIVSRGGARSKVSVRRRGEEFEVRIDDRVYTVAPVAVAGSIRSLLIGGRQYEVSVRGRSNGRYVVTGRGGAEEVLVQDPLSHLAEETRSAAGVKAPDRITAYMPGRVVSVMVAAGERVSAGQGVLVLEAMKMENEIQAEHDGLVRRILVEPGQAVEGGDPLLEME